MLTVSKWLFLLSGVGLTIDGLLILFGKKNPVNADWGLPCPLVLITLGLGVFFFALGSDAF